MLPDSSHSAIWKLVLAEVSLPAFIHQGHRWQCALLTSHMQWATPISQKAALLMNMACRWCDLHG